MRLLAVDAGVTWAVHDVHTGLVAGLRANGHEVVEYALSGRLRASRVTLEWTWRQQARHGGPLADVRPNDADVQYHASQEAVTRALRHEVDWVLVVCAAFFHVDCAVLLRRAGIPAAVVFTESPYKDADQTRVAPHYAACFTNERTSVPRLREANPATYYLPAGYDPATHGAHLNGRARSHDAVFVGTGAPEQGFESRLALLSAADWTGIDLGLYGAWGDTPANHPLAPHIHDGLVDNAQAGALYRAARIGLNLYREPSGVAAESLNPRAYELAADGVYTVSHARAEVREKFGDAVATFASARGLEEAVRGALADPARRRRAAASLPERTAEDTYHHRAAQLVRHLEAQA